MMRSITSAARHTVVLALLASLSTAVPVRAAASDPALLVPVDAVIRAGNGGPVRTARNAYVARPQIIDDFPPFSWSGAGAVTEWTQGLAAIVRQLAITNYRFTRHAPSYVHVAGKRAWLVVPTDFTFTLKGKRQHVSSAWTFVEARTSAGWRIETSAWSTTDSSLE